MKSYSGQLRRQKTDSSYPREKASETHHKAQFRSCAGPGAGSCLVSTGAGSDTQRRGALVLTVSLCIPAAESELGTGSLSVRNFQTVSLKCGSKSRCSLEVQDTKPVTGEVRRSTVGNDALPALHGSPREAGQPAGYWGYRGQGSGGRLCGSSLENRTLTGTCGRVGRLQTGVYSALRKLCVPTQGQHWHRSSPRFS